MGTGYVGLVTAVVLADLGVQVTGVDHDPRKLALLQSGISPIYEPGLEEILRRVIASGKLTFSDSVAFAVQESDVVFIAVGTPSGPGGAPDLTAVRQVASEIGGAIDKYTVVVNKSTVPVGTGKLVEDILLDAGAPRRLFDVVSNPEFLREGSAIRDTIDADRIVIGGDEKALSIIEDLYTPLSRPILRTDIESAELIKYASNSFLAMKISFINAIAQICERTGANVDQVAAGLGSDARIGPAFLAAGLGWGGSCFPKDVRGLLSICDQVGYRFGLLEETERVNEDQAHLFLDRLSARLGGFNGKRIGVLGLAFKPNTDDLRDARSLIIIERILAEGGVVQAYDPVAMANVAGFGPELELCECACDTARDADALLLVTEWNEFRHLNLRTVASMMRQTVLFDGRRFFDREVAEDAGFEYHTIGETLARCELKLAA